MSASVGDQLRQLAAEATPGPWSSSAAAWESVRSSSIPLQDTDARLISLAPDLALLCADLADALAAYESFYDDDCGESGCEDCEPGRRLRALLARVAGLAQEQT